jgi:phage gp29-like protein
MVPVWPGDQADMYGVEHIEPGLAGVDRLLTVIKEFFQHKMKRYILGQILTSEAEATGLGSGVADAHLQTFSDIVEYDAKNLEETVSTDYLRPVQLFNFPQSRRILLRFRLMTEGDKAKEKMSLIKDAWDIGMPIRESDIATASGLVLPKPGERFVCNPQIYGAIQQFQTPINNPNEQMEKHSAAMANSIMNALGISTIASNIPTDDLSIQEKYLTTRP